MAARRDAGGGGRGRQQGSRPPSRPIPSSREGYIERAAVEKLEASYRGQMKERVEMLREGVERGCAPRWRRS